MLRTWNFQTGLSRMNSGRPLEEEKIGKKGINHTTYSIGNP